MDTEEEVFVPPAPITNNSDKNNFQDRQKQLEDKLCTIEKSFNKHKNHFESRVPQLDELTFVSSINRRKIRGFNGRQSIFKRPEIPVSRNSNRALPGYRKNPSKWTCYDMNHIPDMSNESNSAAAFAFLNELKQKKRCESQKSNKIKEKLKGASKELMNIDESESADIDMDVEDRFKGNDKNNAISFKKPQKKEETIEDAPKAEFRNNKIIMPEYQVGVKKVPKKKNLQRSMQEKIDKSKEMKLSHLQQYDDEEEE